VTSRVFVDTNVWVYTVDDGEPAKQARARTVVAPAPDKDVVVSAQVLGEFYTTVRRKLAVTLPESDAVALVDRMRRLPVMPIDGDLVSRAISAAAEWQISYWDALIIAAAEASGCDTLLSEDLSHGRTYGSVRIENPFAPAEPDREAEPTA
jgi:predicted nucleic acid-binding protein